MKSFKRLMALSLASIMTLSMFAGAAFKDETDIKTGEAVSMLETLGVIKGYTDGTFRPTAKITRAEMAKIIYVVRNGGKDDGAKYYENAVNPFTDIKDHWAKGYINYAYTLGIVAGNGKGQFKPDDSVTGLEAAKMLLTVAGYDAQKAGLVGSAWELKTAALASDKNMFDDYEMDFSKPSERQYSAQLVYNSLFSNTVKLVDNEYVDVQVNGEYVLIGEKYMGLAVEEGILLSTGLNSLGDVTGSAKDKIIIKNDEDQTLSYKFKQDASNFIGQNVRVVSNEKNDDIYGVYSASSNVIVDSQLGKVELDDNRIKINDKSYKFEVDAKAYTNGVGEAFADAFATEIKSGTDVKFISNNDDETIDLAIISNRVAGQITGVYKSRITTSAPGFASIALDDDDKSVKIYENPEKDDTVFVSENKFDGSIEVVKIAEVSGEIEAVRQDGVRLDGKWYELSDDAVAGTTLPEVSSEVTLSVNGGYIYAISDEKSAASDLALVTAITENTNVDGNYDAKLLFADDSVKVVKVDKKLTAGSFVTYEKSKDVYKITAVAADNLASFEKYTEESTGFNSNTDKLGTFQIAPDAQIFIQYVEDSETKHTAITGERLAKMSASFGDSIKVLSENKNGFDYAKAALIVTDEDIPNLSGDNSYGLVVESPYVTGGKDDRKVVFTIFDGEENVELSMEATSTTIAKGDFVKFDKISDKELDNVVKIASSASAITAYDKATGEFKVDGDSKVYKITEDTIVIYVDSEKIAGFEDGSIKIADKTDADVFVNNVSFTASSTITDGTYDAEFIAVDINNEMK